MNNELTPKQKAFCDEYMIDMNATRAYKKVYKTCKSDTTAGQNGSRLLKNAKVKAYLDKKLKKRADKAEIRSEDTIREINNLAKADITDIMKLVRERSGRLKLHIEDFNNLPKEVTCAIQSIKQLKDGSVEIKLYDKTKALDMLSKIQGLYDEQQKVEVVTEVNVNNPYANLTQDQLIKLAEMGETDG